LTGHEVATEDGAAGASRFPPAAAASPAARSAELRRRALLSWMLCDVETVTSRTNKPATKTTIAG
jgi:hypothetical protein